MQNWIIAFGICLVAATIEGAAAGKTPLRKLASIRQPRWALRTSGWVAIGLFYYVACFFAIGRLLSAGLTQSFAVAAFALLMILMLANCAWNWLFFQRADYAACYRFMFGYTAGVALYIAILYRVSPEAAIPFTFYAAYLLYAALWCRAVWKLNPKSPSTA